MSRTLSDQEHEELAPTPKPSVAEESVKTLAMRLKPEDVHDLLRDHVLECAGKVGQQNKAEAVIEWDGNGGALVTVRIPLK